MNKSLLQIICRIFQWYSYKDISKLHKISKPQAAPQAPLSGFILFSGQKWYIKFMTIETYNYKYRMKFIIAVKLYSIKNSISPSKNV